MGKPESAVNAVTTGMTFAFKATTDDITGLDSTTSKVWQYTVVDLPGNPEQLNLALGVAADDKLGETDPSKKFRFEGTNHFGTGKIPEMLNNNLAFFLIKVWDKVATYHDPDLPAGTGTDQLDNPGNLCTEDDQLYDALVIGMNVYLSDITKSTARLYDLNPYTETAVTGNNITDQNKIDTAKNAAQPPAAIGSNIARGGLYNTNRANEMVKSGYIDPRDQSKALAPKAQNSDGEWITPEYPLKVKDDSVPTTGNNRDKVSGKIILRGLAWDDQLIDEIQIRIGNDASKTILKLNTSTDKMEAVYTPTTTPVVDYRNKAFAAEKLHWKTGHTVEWAYIWDTETEPVRNGTNMGPATNVSIVVEVKDKNSAAGLTSDSKTSTSDDPENGTYHNSVGVDIVPYIRGFQRRTPDFTTKRSLQGWYSFHRGETGIKVLGYNFGINTTVTMSLNDTNITGTNFVPTGTSSTERTFGIPTGGASGSITLTAGGTQAHNNNIVVADIATKSWNSEYNALTSGSKLWINKPYAHIWRTETQVGNGTITAGTIFGTDGQSAGLESPGMALQFNGSDAGKLHAVWAAPNSDEVFYARNDGNRIRLVRCGEPYIATDIDYFNAGNNNHIRNASAAYSYQRDGGPRLVLKTTMEDNDRGGFDDTTPTIARGINPSSTDRWQNTRISKAAASINDNRDIDPGKVFVTAYDGYYKRLLFTSHGGSNLTAGTDNTNIGNDNEWYLDGGGATTTGARTTNAVGTSIINSNISGSDAVTNGDFNYNQWTRRYVLPVDNPLRTGSGSYVSMKIQRTVENGSGTIDQGNADIIHLAFYNSKYRTVVYAFGTRTGSFTAYAIDRVVEGGQWTDISVDRDGNPWIVYADAANKGKKDGARIAYKGTFIRPLNDPITGESIIGWEAMTMPANFEVKDDRLNIAVWPPIGVAASANATRPHRRLERGSRLRQRPVPCRVLL